MTLLRLALSLFLVLLHAAGTASPARNAYPKATYSAHSQAAVTCVATEGAMHLAFGCGDFDIANAAKDCLIAMLPIPDTGGPNITFLRPADVSWWGKWPDSIDGDGIHGDHHKYDMFGSAGSCPGNSLMPEIIAKPTSGVTTNPSTCNGAQNYANPLEVQISAAILGAVGLSAAVVPPVIAAAIGLYGALHLNPIKTYTVNDNVAGQQYVVNVRQPGHSLFPGYVVHNVETTANGISWMHNYGQGAGWLQSEHWYGSARDQINSVWLGLNKNNVKKVGNKCGC